MKKMFNRVLLTSCFTGTLLLNLLAAEAAIATTHAVTMHTGSASSESTAPQAAISPLPSVTPSPAAMPESLLSEPVTGDINVAQMGQPQGVTLTGGQLQSGIVFTLPSDQVITHARLNLSLRVSPALVARNTALQLMLNGQPLGTLPLGVSDSDKIDYQLDVPSAMVVSNNNLSFRLNDAEQLLCERNAEQYNVTILPDTRLDLEGLQLNVSKQMRNFPRPFIDPMRMTTASVPMIFADQATPEQVSAATIVASWMGIQADYRGINFPVVRGSLPEKNGIVFGAPGSKIGSLTLPTVEQPTLQMVDNPDNPIYKLMLVIGRDENELRQAAWRLVSQPLDTDDAQISVGAQTIPQRQEYDAPNWINTQRPVYLSELLHPGQELTSTGIWHDALRLNFRAAPDLFQWDGDTIPIRLNYRFPSENWIDEDKSFLNVTLNGTFLRNLTVNKIGLLEDIWHRLGGDARQETYVLKLEPYLIYGDNQLQLYFNIKPRPNAPCNVLRNNNIKSRIEENSYIDLSNTRHFTMLPNLSYFVGASFPFSRMADYAQTLLLLPAQPSDAEISTLLNLAGRSGHATGVILSRNQVLFGLPANEKAAQQLQQHDVLGVSTIRQREFGQTMLADSPYQLNGNALSVKSASFWSRVAGWLTGDWNRQQLDADRYFSSNEDWRGFISYRSPWDPARLVVMAVASNDSQLLHLQGDLASSRINAGIRGDTAIITNENGIRSFRVGPQFPSGQMPWYMIAVWYASQHSVLLALLTLLLAAVAGCMLYPLMKRHCWQRLHPEAKNDKTGK